MKRNTRPEEKAAPQGVRRKRNFKGIPTMIVGLLLIAAALVLACYNIWDEQRAGAASDDLLTRLESVIISGKQDDDSDSVANQGSQGGSPVSTLQPEVQPLYVQNPGMEMPVITIEQEDYIGTLSIPSLDLTLPVLDDWSYPKLKKAPCRYVGSVYQGDMIIAAHNYATHFGSINKLRAGDKVTFKDADGNTFIYEVIDLEILQPTDVEAMQTGDWDLTLFTCTVGGSTRVTVRCEKVDELPAVMAR